MIKFIQINLNHGCEAQNLLQYEMAANHIGVAIISEPYRNPNLPDWIGDDKGKAAIWWNPRFLPLSCVAQQKGDGYVIAKFDKLVIVLVYSFTNANLEKTLEEIAESISRIEYKNIIIAGNFNARSIRWKDRFTNKRGKILEAWTDQLDLRLMNEEGIPTCSRPQGDSIIDLTWLSAGLTKRIQNWKVLEDTESYSDHNYIMFELRKNHVKLETDKIKSQYLFPRWSF